SLNRRRFLASIGVGAAGVATLRPAEALANVISEAAGGSVRAGDTFGRIFALQPFSDLNAPSLKTALMAMGQRGGVLDAKDPLDGAGPTGSPQLYDPADRDKFLVQSGGLFEDLPRNANGTAIIADRRNDENLMIAGLHAAFLLFHNRVVDTLRAQGQTGVFA